MVQEDQVPVGSDFQDVLQQHGARQALQQSQDVCAQGQEDRHLEARRSQLHGGGIDRLPQDK